MSTYYVLADKYINSNSANHGYGDYPERVTYVLTKVEADTLRKDQNAAKRQYKGLCFSGVCADRIYTEVEMAERHPRLLTTA